MILNWRGFGLSFALAMLFWLAAGAGSFAARSAEPPRIALVMGNAAYASLGALANPNADARLIGSTLERLGFDVILVLDSDQGGMKRSIADFGRRLRGAGRDAVGLFYYAGHGIQVSGRNYLMPVEARLADAADLDLVGVEANWVLRQMESAGNKTNIVILDACRNNPFQQATRSVSQGLARIDAPPGSFIAYATAPGDVALDGTGSNSPFTAALARAMLMPGKPIEQIFKQVRIDVLAESGGRQTPWDSSSLTDDFYFAGAPENEIRPVEASLWQSVSKSGDPGRLALFLQVYPNSVHATEARALLADAVVQNPNAVLGLPPAGDTVPEQDALTGEDAPPVDAAEPGEAALFAEAQGSGDPAAYRAYLEAHPGGTFAELAQAELAALSPEPEPQPRAEPPAEPAFDIPIGEGTPAIAVRSIAELAAGMPHFPPVEGLDPDFWKTQTCSHCHNWSRENLCTQGAFYTNKTDAAIARIPHPYGGGFKRSLRRWAAAGCR